jgi:hypothetical protein
MREYLNTQQETLSDTAKKTQRYCRSMGDDEREMMELGRVNYNMKYMSMRGMSGIDQFRFKVPK